MDKFDAEAYWSKREKKAWVVALVRTYRENGKRREARDIKYVTARTAEGAARTAKHFSHLKGRLTAYVRLATPWDLGCVPTKSREAA